MGSGPCTDFAAQLFGEAVAGAVDATGGGANAEANHSTSKAGTAEARRSKACESKPIGQLVLQRPVAGHTSILHHFVRRLRYVFFFHDADKEERDKLQEDVDFRRINTAKQRNYDIKRQVAQKKKREQEQKRQQSQAKKAMILEELQNDRKRRASKSTGPYKPTATAAKPSMQVSTSTKLRPQRRKKPHHVDKSDFNVRTCVCMLRCPSFWRAADSRAFRQ